MLREKFALTERGAFEFKRGALFCALANIVMMAPIGALCMVTNDYLSHLINPSNPVPELGGYLVAIVIIVLLMLLAQWLEYNFTYNVVYGESARKRIELAELLRKLPLSFFGKRDLADLTTTIMKDCADQERMFSHIMPFLFGTGASTALISIMLLLFNWKMAIAALWVLPIALLFIIFSRKNQDEKGQLLIDRQLDVANGLQEYLECIQEITAANQSKTYLDQLDQTIDRAEKAQIASELSSAVPVSTAQAFLKLGMASTILVGALLLASGEIDFMVYFCFLLVVTRFYDPINTVLEVVTELLNLKLGIKRMLSIEHERPQTGLKEFNPKNYDISFNKVSFSYEGGERVLSDVSFIAKEGEVTALVGPSGSGKSTAAKLAARFWDANEGVVSVGGVDVSTIDPEALLVDFAQVFQDVVLFDDTIMQNIRLGRSDATDEEVLAAAKAANCDDFVSRMPEGYKTTIGENGALLSGGERQRISIARAILKDAPIVLLDEATASLDVESETRVQEALSRLLQHKTVLVIAHRMRTVMNADKIVVLDKGHVVEQGKPSELTKCQDGLFRKMVELQATTNQVLH